MSDLMAFAIAIDIVLAGLSISIAVNIAAKTIAAAIRSKSEKP